MADETYVILFRGVGGATKLPTEPLREALTEAGFRSVRTYIASGNAVLGTDAPAAAAKAEVAAIAREKFGFAKEIMILTRRDMAELIAGNPFRQAVSAPTTLHAFALASEPSRDAVEALGARAAPSEQVIVKGKVLYFHAPDGFGVSRLPPAVDRILGVASTARNWNTVLKLAALADEVASEVAPGAKG